MRGDSKSKVDRSLAVHHSTIGRELKRNKGSKGYRYLEVHENGLTSWSLKPNTKIDAKIKATIGDKLGKQWSPIKISGLIKKHCKDNISHQSIYGYIRKNKNHGEFYIENCAIKGKNVISKVKEIQEGDVSRTELISIKGPL